MLEISHNSNYHNIINELNSLSAIGPNTFVRKSNTTQRFIPLAGSYSYLPGVQTAASWYKGRTVEQTAVDIEDFAQRAINEIIGLNQAIKAAKDVEVQKGILNDIVTLKTAIKETKEGRVENGGINGIIETYKPYNHGEISSRISAAYTELEQVAEKAEMCSKAIFQKHDNKEKSPAEALKLGCPEEEYSDQRWEKEIKESHDLQKEVPNIQKYNKYAATLFFNMAKNTVSSTTGSLQKWIFGEDYNPGWDWWNKIGHFEKADLFLGALPLSAAGGRNDLKDIKAENVKAILSVVEVFENKTEGTIVSPITPKEWESAGIKQLQLPTPDFKSISIEKIMRGVEFIHWNLKNGRSLYIHCKAGRGRSALILMCYLIKYQGMTADQAFAQVRKNRHQAGFGPKSDKMATLRQFEKLVKQNRK